MAIHRKAVEQSFTVVLFIFNSVILENLPCMDLALSETSEKVHYPFSIRIWFSVTFPAFSALTAIITCPFEGNSCRTKRGFKMSCNNSFKYRVSFPWFPVREDQPRNDLGLIHGSL